MAQCWWVCGFVEQSQAWPWPRVGCRWCRLPGGVAQLARFVGVGVGVGVEHRGTGRTPNPPGQATGPRDAEAWAGCCGEGLCLRCALLRELRASPAVRSARVRGGGQHRGDRAGLRAAQRAHVRGRAAGGVPRAGTALRCRAPRTETVIRASPPYGPRGTQGAVPGDADAQRSGGSRVWTPAWETRCPGRRAA